MRVQTFSIVAGGEACNAACPFCVSKMTPPNGVELKAQPVRWDRFRKACQFAKAMNVTTVMITGKGEPTLFPTQISEYLQELREYDFPFVELQSNGLVTAAGPKQLNDSWLSLWSDLGLTTYAISVVHYLPERNQEIYYSHRPNAPYMDLPALIRLLHDHGLSVRLSVVLLKSYIDSPELVIEMISFAQRHKVEQLTLRPAAQAADPSRDLESLKVDLWTAKHLLEQEQLAEIERWLEQRGALLLTLQHGAKVYDVDGQNVCLTECLTKPVGEDIRQVIFFPDGHLRYDWQYAGAILM